MKVEVIKKVLTVVMLSALVSCVGVEDLNIEELNVEGNTVNAGQGSQQGDQQGGQQGPGHRRPPPPGQYGQVINDNFNDSMDVFENDQEIILGQNEYRLPPHPPMGKMPNDQNDQGAIGVDINGKPIKHCTDQQGEDSLEFEEEDELFESTSEDEMIGILNNGTPIYGDESESESDKGRTVEQTTQTTDFPAGIYHYRYIRKH
jgi:hypothetical protein